MAGPTHLVPRVAPSGESKDQRRARSRAESFRRDERMEDLLVLRRSDPAAFQAATRDARTSLRLGLYEGDRAAAHAVYGPTLSPAPATTAGDAA